MPQVESGWSHSFMKTTPLTALVLDISRSRKKDTDLHAFLKERTLQVKSMRDPRRGAEILRKGMVQLVLLVVGRRSSHDPVEVLDRFHAANSDIPVIVISPRPKLDEAVSLVRGNAYDYLDRKTLWVDLEKSISRAIADKGYTLSREEKLNETLGERIRSSRLEQELTLKQLSTRAGVSISLISQIELARSNASVSTLHKLTRALNLSLEQLFADF